MLNANTVMIPVWAAALAVLSPRAPRARQADAFLAGAFASLTMLGRCWATFLLPTAWRSASFGGAGRATLLAFACAYLMALGAAMVPRSACLVDADPKSRQRSVRRERGCESHAVQRRIMSR